MKPLDKDGMIHLTGKGCLPLPAKRTADGYETVWQLSADERAAIARGGVVALKIFGKYHPPVLLTIADAADTAD